MIRKIASSALFAVIVFCVISYISVMSSLLSTAGKPNEKPVTNIGFPFKYYYQFWDRNANSPNCGWNIGYFFIDAAIIWIIILLIQNYRSKKTVEKNKSRSSVAQ